MYENASVEISLLMNFEEIIRFRKVTFMVLLQNHQGTLTPPVMGALANFFISWGRERQTLSWKTRIYREHVLYVNINL